MARLRFSVCFGLLFFLVVVVSLTGMILMLYIKRKRVSGLILALLGLILSYLITNMVTQNPNTPIAFWASIIPFSSPMVMMAA